MRFTFVGNVTRVPVKGSLPLTTVFGQQFYITAGNLGSFTSSDAWVPAWVIPVDEKKANLEYSVVQVPYEFSWTSFMKTETVQTKLSIFCLTPKKQFIDAKNVELFRPAASLLFARVRCVCECEGLILQWEDVPAVVGRRRRPRCRRPGALALSLRDRVV